MKWTVFPAEEFDRHRDVWQEMVAVNFASPLLSSAFVLPLMKFFRTGDERFAICTGPHGPVALTLLTPQGRNAWATFLPAGPVGVFLMARGAEFEMLMRGLIAALPGFSFALRLTRQDPDLLPRPADNRHVATVDCTRPTRIAIRGSFEDYWARRAASLKSDVDRSLNELQIAGIEPRLEVLTGGQQVAQAIIDYGNLEGAAHNSDSQPKVHPNSTQGWFYRTILEEFCSRGSGRIYRYWFNQKVVAMALCIEGNGSLLVLKTTCDQGAEHPSPALLMNREIIRNIFDEARIKILEFHGALPGSQRDWNDEFRILYDVNYYRWPWLAKMPLLRPPTKHGLYPGGGRIQGRPVDGPGGKYAVTRYDDLSAMPDGYAPLFSRAGNTSLFYTLPWYRNFINSVLAPDERLRVYAVHDDAKPGTAAAVLLMQYRDSGAGGLSARTLSGLSNYYTSLFGPVLESESDQQRILDTLVAAIASDELHWDVIDLQPLSVNTPVFPALVKAFQNAGMLVHTYFCFGNWHLQVRGRSYAEYFETLPSQLKHTILRKKKQLLKSDRSRIVVCRDMAGLDQALYAYEQIYAASWKIPEPYPEFIRGLCRACAEMGWLRLGVIYVDDKPIASQIWIVNDRIATIYKLAYDQHYARLSAGSILTAHLMEYVIDSDQVREIDYLTGDDAYKKDWMSDRRERWGIIAFDLRTPRGLFTASLRLARSAAKRAINMVGHSGATAT